MSSPSRAPEIAPETLAAAAQRRALAGQAYISPEMQSLHEYELRLSFRRLIDPGIVRPNSKDTATSSLKTLLTISENILRDPENPKYLRFKATNDTIKKRLIEPKGALEYAIALGFRPDVEDFQPFYRFNPKKMIDLRVGAAILKEAIELDTEKQERLDRSKREEKAAAAAVASNIKMAFLDDRKTKLMRDQRERERREARAAAVAAGTLEEHQAPSESMGSPTPSSPHPNMPGEGRSLLTIQSTDVDSD
ncbi:hypothetical protein FIBSPDRAFT_774381 [Athelia psychrophila]|uniref:PUB domain-containing protein n=1 Tax=Athelia psychrophila TaxID=1759441 RepID=A0A166VSY9_9AGAM|nr:hypothetical protein FIBSPDRAFT_774381 [Fibularhizoctonia sp. CBS 109695]